jgi:hypothetical protein
VKWPLVWREDYDDACRSLRQLEVTIYELRAHSDALLKETARLTDLLHLVLLTPEPKADTKPVLAPLPVPQKDEVAEAVELAAGTDTALARHLGRWAAQQKLDGMKEHDIIQSLLHWRGANEWDGSDADAPSFL